MLTDIARRSPNALCVQVMAEMGAEPAEDEAEFIVGIAVPVETAEHEEPTAGRDLLPHPRQVFGHRGQREFVSRHRRVIRVAAPSELAPRRSISSSVAGDNRTIQSSV